MPILPHVFKAYDIRGLSPGELDTDFAYRLGQAFVRYTRVHTVVVGKDMRVTTPELATALTRGILSQGVDVVDVGLVTTPMFYFAVAERGSTPTISPSTGGGEKEGVAGVMVTASHNPAKYNGFKIVRTDATPIGGEEIQELRKLVEQAPFPTKPEGNVVETEVADAYLEKVLELADVSKLKKLPVVIDAGNGMNGCILPALTKRIGMRVVPLYWELDGTFPHHEANPIKEETLRDLKERVRTEGADLGIAYDGDGDRVGFVDGTGETVPAYLIGALLVPELLRKHPNAPVLYDVRCSNVLREEIERAGGVPVMTPVGHAFIKKIMRERGGKFAVELSAHYYFQDFYGVECSDLAALLVMEKVARTGKKLSELIEPLRRYAHSGEINFEIEDTERAMRALEERYGMGRVGKIDGLRVDFDDWWFSVRPSNTEPVLRLVLEAKSLELMEEKRDELSRFIISNR